MFRQELSRIFELADAQKSPINGLFYKLDESLTEIPQKLKQYRDFERDLEALDLAAWAFLKSELIPLLNARHPTRGWQQLFDKLNEAKGYKYLKNAGYPHQNFIKRATVRGHKTPDLWAQKNIQIALCEVKTINISEIEAVRRRNGGVASIGRDLNKFFFCKLENTLAAAEAQIDAYATTQSTTKVIEIGYVVVNFDDFLREYADDYRQQVDDYMASNTSPLALEAVFDIWPAYYRAMI